MEVEGNGPSPRMNHSLTYVDGFGLVLYGGAGEDTSGEFGVFYRLDPERRLWTRLVGRGVLPRSRSSHTACAVGRTLVVFGGRLAERMTASGKVVADGEPTDDLFALDLDRLEWRQVVARPGAPWPRARLEHAMCAARADRLIVHGGCDGHQTFGDMWMLSCDAMEWREVVVEGALSPSPRAKHSAVCLRSSARVPGATTSRVMVIFGGVDDRGDNQPVDESLFVFKFGQREWVRPVVGGWRPAGRSDHVAFAGPDNGMFIVGGDTRSLAAASTSTEMVVLREKSGLAATAAAAAAEPRALDREIALMRGRIGEEAARKTAPLPGPDETYSQEFHLAKWKTKAASLGEENARLRETVEAHERELAFRGGEIADLINEVDRLRYEKKLAAAARKKEAEAAEQARREQAQQEARAKAAYDLEARARGDWKQVSEEKRRLAGTAERVAAMEATFLENLKGRVANEKALAAANARLAETERQLGRVTDERDAASREAERSALAVRREQATRERVSQSLSEERAAVAALQARVRELELREESIAEEERRRAREAAAVAAAAAVGVGVGVGAAVSSRGAKKVDKRDEAAEELARLREEVKEERRKRQAAELKNQQLDLSRATEHEAVRRAEELRVQAEFRQFEAEAQLDIQRSEAERYRAAYLALANQETVKLDDEEVVVGGGGGEEISVDAYLRADLSALKRSREIESREVEREEEENNKPVRPSTARVVSRPGVTSVRPSTARK
jgi:hypothetical protein